MKQYGVKIWFLKYFKFTKNLKLIKTDFLNFIDEFFDILEKNFTEYCTDLKKSLQISVIRLLATNFPKNVSFFMILFYFFGFNSSN